MFIAVTVMLGLLLTTGQPAAAEASGTWGATRSYPVGVADQSCVTVGAFIYCIGGFVGDTYTANGTQSTAEAYYAQPSLSGGISSWANTTSYPTMVNTESCAASEGYVYCVGGYSSRITDRVYYAAVSSGGISRWNSSTSYPAAVFGQSCATWDSYIYCVGGYSSDGLPTDAVYFAGTSASGVSAWTRTTDYPTNVTSQSCVLSEGYLYCIGGIDDQNPPITDAVYYGALSANGISSWTETTSYPMGIDIQSCVLSGQDLYCIGGAPEFAATNAVYRSTVLAQGGLTPWTRLADFPTTVAEQSCVAIQGYIYCIAGAPSAFEELDHVYYAATSALNLTAEHPASAGTGMTSDTNTTNEVGPGSASAATTMSMAAGNTSLSSTFLVVLSANVALMAVLCWMSTTTGRGDRAY